jgi:hypothetical protein
MFATAMTRDFKMAVVGMLEESRLGYDTRYRYYRRQFPELTAEKVTQMICDPIETYDRDWRQWRAAQTHEVDDQTLITRFFLERDSHFRNEAQVAIICLDEAGFGSGVNIMRFIQAGKPILGFYHDTTEYHGVNIGNFIQLQIEYPRLMHLFAYQNIEDILGKVRRWLIAFSVTHT